MPKRYFYNIDFLRFIFCISILLMHFSRFTVSDIAPYVHKIGALKDHFILGYICVEFFFIISGFLWGIKAEEKSTISEFAKKKIIRFSPLMVFAVLCSLICSFFGLTVFEIEGNMFSLAFLGGFNFKHHYIVYEMGNLFSSWYIQVLFWVLLLYHYLHSTLSKKTFNLLIITTVIVGYQFLTTMINGNLDNNLRNFYGIFNFGFIRGLCAVGIGYLIAEFYKNYYPKVQDIKLSLTGKTIITAVDFIALSYILVNIFYVGTLALNDIFYVYCFVIVMLCFVFNKDYLSNFLNNKYFAFLGKYSLAIYIMHNLCMDAFKSSFFTKANIPLLKEYPYLSFSFAIIFSILVGIIAYYLVEKPASKYLSKYIKRTTP